jgi:L-asparaginase
MGLFGWFRYNVYSASALSFMLENLSKPVIFYWFTITDRGFAHRCQRKFNYRYSNCFFARKWVPVITEVCLYFEYKLYRGNRTTKINAEHFKAFTSPNYPAMVESGVHLNMRIVFSQK